MNQHGKGLLPASFTQPPGIHLTHISHANDADRQSGHDCKVEMEMLLIDDVLGLKSAEKILRF